MNLSAILVVTSPQDLEACGAALTALPGVEIHYTDPPSGRIILTQEAESVDAEVAGLKRIKALSKVILAEFIYHYFEEDDEQVLQIPSDLDDLTGLPQAQVPGSLTE